MRKNLLIALAVTLSTTAFAQNRVAKGIKLTPFRADHLKNTVAIPKHAIDVRKAGPVEQNSSKAALRNAATPNTTSSITDDFVGATYYDLQTNASISNRFLRHPDGTRSAVWTTSCGNQGTDRGTGYNYWDGSQWTIPNSTGSPNCARIESVRVGFTNVAVTASGHEMCFGHSSTQGSLNLCYRGTKGSGTWADSTPLGTANNDTWAKGIAGGTNGESVHIIAQGTGVTQVPLNGQDGPLYYYRSLDGGVTWPIIQQTFPGLDSADNAGFGGDSYSIDTRGDMVAIVCGDFTTSMYLLKSMDNGNTWTKSVVVQSPLPQPWADDVPYPDLNGDGGPDTLELPGGDAHVMIDNNNICHIWWSTVLCVNSDGTGTGYFPNALDGLYYWNENMTSPVIIAAAADLNLNGVLDIPSTGLGGGNGAGTYRGSLTQMPSSGIDAAGNLYVSYQTINETTDTTIYNTLYKQIYVIKSTDGGATWTDPLHAYNILQDSDSSIEEGVFACMAKYVDSEVHICYQRDYAPGHSLATNTTEAGWNAGVPSDIICAHFPATDIPTGISNPTAVNYDFDLYQNQPNPAHGYTDINFSLHKTSSVKLEVTDVIGKLVYSEDQGSLSKGGHMITVNTTGMNAGIYFYSLSVNGQKITKKMIVE